MLTKDLHVLPKVRDRLSYLYVEHAKVDREDKAIAFHTELGVTPVPCANLTLLMLGPGVSITHAAILTLADCGCLVAWVGEGAVRFYASGSGTTRSSVNLMRQASAWADPQEHMRIVRLMYEKRFPEKLDPSLSLQQIRGKEGVRVRDTYYRLSKECGVAMEGRNYQRNNWSKTDPVNRALSVANSCLYGVCHAAIIAAGFSPALGFIHTGKQLSFVYDVADLYKMEISVPAAFQAAAAGVQELDRRVRLQCRDEFYRQGLLKDIVSDLYSLFGEPEPGDDTSDDIEVDAALPGGLWNPDGETCPGGVAYGTDEVKEE